MNNKILYEIKMFCNKRYVTTAFFILHYLLRSIKLTIFNLYWLSLYKYKSPYEIYMFCNKQYVTTLLN